MLNNFYGKSTGETTFCSYNVTTIKFWFDVGCEIFRYVKKYGSRFISRSRLPQFRNRKKKNRIPKAIPGTFPMN